MIDPIDVKVGRRLDKFLRATPEFFQQWQDGLITHAEAMFKIMYLLTEAMKDSRAMNVRAPLVNAALPSLSAITDQDQLVTWVCLAFGYGPTELYEILSSDCPIGPIRISMVKPDAG